MSIVGNNGSTQGLTVLNDGSVGIGTATNVTAKLEIRAPSETAFINLVPTSSTGTSSQGEIRFWGDQSKYGTRYASIRNTNSGGTDQNDLAFLTNAIERMRITDTGRVGIGVTDTNYLFEVAGTARINGNLTIGSISTIADNNLVLTSNSGVVSAINTANWDKNAADDYQNWVAKSNTTNYVIGNGTTLSFTPGTDIGITPSTNNFTFNNTSTLQSVTSRGATTNQQLTLSYNGAPFVLSSGNTTVVTNLNANYLEGKRAQDFLQVGYTGFDNYRYWTAAANGVTYPVTSTSTFNFTGTGGIDISLSGNTLTLNNTNIGTTYTSGVGLTLSAGNIFNILHNTSLAINTSNQLGLNLANSNTWTAVQNFNNNFTVGSTALITNLNADLLDGKHLNELPYAAGATNGLQMIGNNVGLGGTLTQNTIINNPSHSLSIIGQDDAIGFHVSKLGTVGIGLTTPQGIFHIAGRGTANQNFRFDWASNDPNYKPTIFTLRSRDNAGVNAPIVDGDALFMQEISGLSSSSTPYSAARWGAGVDGTVSATSVPGYLYFATTAQGDTGATERLRIASNGNIGIGTSSPQYKLDVNGIIALKGSDFFAYDTYNGENTLQIGNRSGSAIQDATVFFVDSSPVMSLTSGNIGLGTTDPLYRLDVNGQARISNLPTGTTDNVITQNNGVLQTRSIDSRVWGNTLSSGTGTANYSARWLSTNILGTGAIYDNGTNVAIGTNNPINSKLRIISNNTPNSYFGGITIDSNDTSNRHSLVISTNQDNRYSSIQSSNNSMVTTYTPLILNPLGGNVGIGTTNVTSRLTITDNNGSVVHLRESDTGTRSGLTLGFYTNVAAIWGQNLVNNASSPGPLLLNPEGGNVGIGLKSPGYNLHLHNDTGTSNFMQITTYNTGISTNDGLVIGYNDADGAKIVNRENTSLFFSTNNTARMTISASGNVSIGTTPNPNTLLHLYQASTPQISFSDSTGSNPGIYLGTANAQPSLSFAFPTGEGSNRNFNFRAAGADRFTILAGGNVGIGHTRPTYKLQVAGNAANTTGVWTNYSDSRLKNSIVSLDLSDSLDKITRLNPVAFNWNDPVKNAEFGRVRGFIAQEMEAVIPEWVITDPSGYKAIQPIGIDAMLVASIKELNTKIEGLDITADGAVVVNYNVSDEVLATLGYNGTKNELENGSYSLTDNLGHVVNRVGQFGRLAVNKLTAGLISSKAVITDNLAAKHVASETIVTGDLVSTQIGTTALTALKIGASEASFSTLYADQIINPEGNISDVMASKIGNLREEIKSFIASASATTEATPSAIAQNAETWDTSVPTDNLELTEMDNLTLSGDLVVSAQLIVTGQTLLQNAAITDMLTVGQIALRQNILETTADTLFIQPSGQGSVDILNGRLLISSNGTIRINSDVIVSGSLTANILKADEIETQKLNIAVATASAESTPSADSPSQNVTNDATAGFITLATGQTEVTINNSQLTANSMVYLTPNGSTQNQVPYVKNKTEDNFTIAIDSPLDHDVNINWWLIN